MTLDDICDAVPDYEKVLVYSDWCEEHDDVPAAEALRALAAYTRWPCPFNIWETLPASENEWAWFAHLKDKGDWAQYRLPQSFFEDDKKFWPYGHAEWTSLAACLRWFIQRYPHIKDKEELREREYADEV